MRSRSNGGVIGAYALPNQNYANGVFFIHDAAIFNTGANPIWPLSSGFIYSATGGTITTAADNINYKVHTFTSNSTFTVSDGAGELEILLVGGGGTGGSAQTAATSYYYQTGGGGGGGGVTLVKTWVNPGTTFTVTIGRGATNPINDITATYNGGSSTVTSTSGHSYTATGGGGGSSSYYNLSLTANSGGSGGGGRARNDSIGVGASAGGTYTYANAGGDGSTNLGVTGINAGGGGGAGGVGYPGHYSTNTTFSSRGGDGWLWSRTNAYYGSGGGGGRSYNATVYSPRSAGQGAGGLSGPYPGTRTGTGGHTSTSSSGDTGGSVNQAWYYGAGGGGAVQNATTTSQYFGGSGGPGTVIFCYRYK